MQDVVQGLIEKAQPLYHILLTNPWPLLFAVAVGVPLYWFKGRHLYKSLRANRLAGWSVQAEAGQTMHKTGIGMRDAMILKPLLKFMLIGVFVILVFGNLGWPYLADPDLIWPPTRLKDVDLMQLLSEPKEKATQVVDKQMQSKGQNNAGTSRS